MRTQASVLDLQLQMDTLNVHLRLQVTAVLQPDAQTTNRRIGDKSDKPKTDNTRKSKFSRNKTSTHLTHKEGPIRFLCFARMRQARHDIGAA